MPEKWFYLEKKEDIRIFESLVIYLALWYKDWLNKDLFSTEKRVPGFVIGKKKGGESVDLRINKLKKAGVPISDERKKQKQTKDSFLVKLDRERVINEFIEEIDLYFDESQTKFRDVISRAVPFIIRHIDNYHQDQSFDAFNLQLAIEGFVITWGRISNCIKFFPIWLSFCSLIKGEDKETNTAIKLMPRPPWDPNVFDNDMNLQILKRWARFSLKWEQAYYQSRFQADLPFKIAKYFLCQLPGVAGLIEGLFLAKDGLHGIYSSLDSHLKEFRENYFHERNDLKYSLVENMDFVLLLRLAQETLYTKFPSVFNHPFLEEKIDCTRDLHLTLTIPIINQEDVLKIDINVPLTARKELDRV